MFLYMRQAVAAAGQQDSRVSSIGAGEARFRKVHCFVLTGQDRIGLFIGHSCSCGDVSCTAGLSGAQSSGCCLLALIAGTEIVKQLLLLRPVSHLSQHLF